MNYAPWMTALGPDDEPDYHAYWHETETLADAMIDIATYDDWFPDLTRSFAAMQQADEDDGEIDEREPLEVARLIRNIYADFDLPIAVRHAGLILERDYRRAS